MIKKSSLYILISTFICSCYCYKQSTSVRDFEKSSSYSLCEYEGNGDGKSVPLNLYYGDPIYSNLHFEKLDSPGKVISRIQNQSPGVLGVRFEKFIPAFNLPIAILGLGLDYSKNNYSGEYFTIINSLMGEEQKMLVKSKRLLFSLSMLTLVKPKTIGYFTLQPGWQWNKYEVKSSIDQFVHIEKFQKDKFNFRIGYGFQFYLNGPFAFTIEAGYGGGTFFRGGICWWVF